MREKEGGGVGEFEVGGGERMGFNSTQKLKEHIKEITERAILAPDQYSKDYS